ncbi:MAG: hypothetical protein FWH27_05150 [Planctomycetaceae bacterium]|nr:hypothetical protein [Planctomycetaceae bacterium]
MMKSRYFVFILICFVCAKAFAAEPVKHRLLLNDESRFQLLSVDEIDPESNWVIKAGEKIGGGDCVRDLQLIGNHRVLTAIPGVGGFREYDLTTRKVVREVTNSPRYRNSMTAVRMPDGRTLLGCDQGHVRIFVLDAEGRETNALDFPQFKVIRLMRRTCRDTLLFGTNTDHIVEVDLKGNMLRDVQIPDAQHVYQVIELANGNLLCAAGYGGFLAEIDRDGKIVKTWGGNPPPEGLLYYFMSQFQVLKNGNIVVATWTGHDPNDSNKGQQLVEFDKDGNVVWTWHDPKLAGSIHGVIVLDDGIDIGRFYDDTHGVLSFEE